MESKAGIKSCDSHGFSKSSIKPRRSADERRSLLFRRQTCVQGDALVLACDTQAAIFLRSLSARIRKLHAARSIGVLSRQLSFHVKGVLFWDGFWGGVAFLSSIYFAFVRANAFFRPLASNASPVRIFSLQAGRPSALTLRALVFPVYPPSRPARAHFTPRRVSTSAAKSRTAPLCLCRCTACGFNPTLFL